MKKIFAILLLALCWTGHTALAQLPPLKIGLIGPYSGPDYDSGGARFDEAIKVFFRLHGDTVAGRKIEFIRRDVPRPAPELAKRLATELVTVDKVDFLAGALFTPNALAIGQVSGATNTPFVIMNAATSGIMEKIPNAVRMSFSQRQTVEPMGVWASKNGIKRVFTIVVDYAPGIDTENSFSRTFTAGGGEVVEKLRVPMNTTDFSSYVRRIRDAKVDAVYIFLPNSDMGRSFLKAFKDGELKAAGVRLLAEGAITTPLNLPVLGDDAIGIISSFHYTETHPSPLNQEFVKAFAEVNEGHLPTFVALDAYDALTAIYKAVEAQNGKLTLEKTMQVLSNLKMESPRGPIEIDPDTRDIIQNIYIRRVEKRDGKLVNMEFETLPRIKP